jgi:Holin of 3TMs, for gene-transfer release
MDWKDVGEVVGKIAPGVGALFGPLGAGLGAIVSAALGVENTPDAVAQAIKTDPDAAVKLQQILSDERVKIQDLQFQAFAAQLNSANATIAAVNATMQAETKAEHWASWMWRPYIGFVTGTMVFGCYFVLPLMKVPVPMVPTDVWWMLGGILGIASWFRGKAQADPGNPAPVRG